MYSSVTQFIWRFALGMDHLSPPEQTGKKSLYGKDDQCFLCGGNTEGKGWHKKDVITAAFTDINQCKNTMSETVCDSCAATMKQEGWHDACVKYGYSPHFPIKEGKAPVLSNWMFSSHIISEGKWEQPMRSGLRDALMSPPEPPFVITIADAGKKHVLFRADVNYSRDVFTVQLDDEKVLIDRDVYERMLNEFEECYSMGFSKSSLLTGEYNQAAILKAGIKTWREVENKMHVWRTRHNDIMRVVALLAKKHEVDE